MTTTWVLIADRSHARIVAHRAPGKGLELVEEIEHPEGRLRDGDIDSDVQGRSFDIAGEGRHAMSQSVLPHEQVAIAFARQLAEKVRAGRNEHRFDQLVLAAEPRFLGLLRDALDAPTRQLVSAEIHKHLLGHNDGDLERHLAEVIRL